MKFKNIKTTITEFLNEHKNISIKAYRGIGNKTNFTYGGNDDGIGTFYTDNLTMAKWFAGMIEFNSNTGRYENIYSEGKIIEKLLTFNNPYIINSNDYDYDSFQMYMDEIERYGGVLKYKQYLVNKQYDGIILKNNNTNYYEDDYYDIYIKF